MSRLTNAIAALGLSLAGAIAAQAEQVIVVELFTSQGCSSCPPADELMVELAGRNDVVALALHVDYWDYIGWKDEFADPAYTQRQKLYARAAGSRSIYTPQFVVQGVDHVVGYRPMDLAQVITQHYMQQQKSEIALTVDVQDGVVSVDPSGAVPEGAVLQIVTYKPEESVSIRRGENAGRTITYANIVTSWSLVDSWVGDAVSVPLTPAPGDQVVAIMQSAQMGRILAAARP
ncbi:hypothetical protein ACMU_17885 [Actibacterium mucosum KCTC 23349]|uniref:Uncharacterized protein n=1 Tax=Actibacterium mucosum KCTC 23349 TaxID=1454373 RepID=A0A037ZEL0_9RHOB|nr:DUF1223 domain-containing protein [Actibacterium mucosum]KAJ54577.1 hypothetical protein ACMU_17885 [Actibacterium mucosum KCTC 23349]